MNGKSKLYNRVSLDYFYKLKKTVGKHLNPFSNAENHNFCFPKMHMNSRAPRYQLGEVGAHIVVSFVFSGAHLLDKFFKALRDKRRVPAKELVQHTTQRPQVGGVAIRGIFQEKLGRHIGWATTLGFVDFIRGLWYVTGVLEIVELDGTKLINEEVGWLHVAHQDALTVHVQQRLHNIAAESDNCLFRKAPIKFLQLGNGTAAAKFCDCPDMVASLVPTEEFDNVLML